MACVLYSCRRCNKAYRSNGECCGEPLLVDWDEERDHGGDDWDGPDDWGFEE